MGRIITTEIFINDCLRIHGSDLYDYSLTKFVRTNQKVEVFCKTKGHIFKIRASDHLDGRGCPICAREASRLAQCKSLDDRIEEFRKIHGNKFGYGLIHLFWRNASSQVPIYCFKHEEFYWQTLGCHRRNKIGCPKCRDEVISKQYMKSEKELIEEFKTIHKDKYNYEIVEPKESQSKVKVFCLLCESHFETKAYNLSRGIGCKCQIKRSKGADKIWNFLIAQKINFKSEHRFKDCVNPLTNRTLIFDFYLPDLNLCIEFDGEQHFHPSSFCTNKTEAYLIENLNKNLYRDKIKNKYCKQNYINLLRIHYKHIKQVNTIISDFVSLIQKNENKVIHSIPSKDGISNIFIKNKIAIQ